MAPEDPEEESKQYSYVDVLERVADGVHVDVVNRRTKRHETGKVKEKPAHGAGNGSTPRRHRRRVLR